MNQSDIMLNTMLNPATIAVLAKQHTWAATGVSDYPPRDPLVGQSRFFKRYKTFIHTVDQDADNFAHVFAVEAEWGRGKSRLGHELVAQINDCSQGWYVREQDGGLKDQQLFDQAGRDRYLALYIRYSQVASDYQNSDNWFAFGLYKALLPLANRQFDGSIQSKIAEQALRRLAPMGFDPAELSERLQLAANHPEETLYEDPTLVVGLVQSAYDYLTRFGIQYVLVVLDELETVAEAATFGMEPDDTKRLDGQAIRLIGKAIKEEDPRRKLPWLRYVALCSPLLGQQLREIQSVARRFELVELEHNAFADVSDYVAQLKADRKLAFDYPTGLVEAAYAMSGANFGWFNVIMANIDAVLDQFQQAGRGIPPIGELFDAVVEGSGRVAQHVLDAHAISNIKTGDQSLLAVARQLLYGQLPLPLSRCPARSVELLTVPNEDGEPVASHYVQIPYSALKCRQALDEAKFQRLPGTDEWQYPAVEQALDLSVLLQNLRTFAINEADPNVLLLPLLDSEFKHLLSLLYDHPAVEFAADALWRKLVGTERQLPTTEATHIGPSVAMLLRLDLRYRSRQQNSMIFRDPAHADAHEAAMKRFALDTMAVRLQARLTGLFRLLDRNWQYAQAPYANPDNLSIQLAPRGQGQGQHGGLVNCDAFKLHPDGQAWFAWVSNRDELERLHKLAGLRRTEDGRTPVMAFTASTHLMEQYGRGDVTDALRDDVLLYYLNPSEVDQVERVGLAPDYCTGFELNDGVFTSKFKNKLNAVRDFAYQAMHHWRKRLNERGLIAWPLRPGGKLSTQDRELLYKAWKLLTIDQPALQGLNDIEQTHGIDAEEVAKLLQRLVVSGRVLAQGYAPNEHAGLFTEPANPQQTTAKLPVFLARIANPARTNEWTLDRAKRDWYWGYLWHPTGVTARSVFDDWMWWCGELHLLQLEGQMSAHAKWVSYPRAALDNAITEAANWFTGSSPDGYRATVSKLERVFGYDRIPGLFAPLDKSPIGTETVEANDQLQAARARFDKLKIDEEALTGENVLPVIADRMPALLQSRSEILARVVSVKPLVTPAISLDNIHTIRLDDRKQSLYYRIEQARQFADFVEKAAVLIKNRIASLITEISEDCAGLTHFPQSLFTLSLQTVANILDGALQQQNNSGTSQTEAAASSDTLLHYLRSLQLDKAAERLRLLAAEAGVNIATDTTLAFAAIDGHIVRAYRAGKEKYVKVTDYLGKLQAGCAEALRQLEPLPTDYPEQSNVQEVTSLQQQLILIGDAFEDLTETARDEREKFREQARKGQFAAIRDVPDRLLQPIQSQLQVIGGKMLGIENAIRAYQNMKLEAVNDEIAQTFRPLFAASRQPVPQPILLEQVKSKSLHELQMELDIRSQGWQRQSTQLLDDTGLDLDGWRGIAIAISQGTDPAINPTAQLKLVEKGILKVKLAFGGAE